MFATIFYSYLLFSIIRVYLFGQELPEFTRFLLDQCVGQNRRAVGKIAFEMSTAPANQYYSLFTVPSESVLLALVLILLQVVRRLCECIFVSVYSSAKMHLIHYIYGTLYYFGVGLSVLAEANGLTDYRKPLSCLAKCSSTSTPSNLL